MEATQSHSHHHLTRKIFKLAQSSKCVPLSLVISAKLCPNFLNLTQKKLPRKRGVVQG